VLRAEMRGYVDRGYTVVKMKIGGADRAEDQRRIEAVLSEIDGRARLAVDANGRFDLPTAIAYARMLRSYPLFWFEEPGDPLDFALQAALAAEYPGPMATGENLFSHQDARNLLRYAGLRPDRTGCSSTARSRTACANTSARWPCSRRKAGRGRAASRTAGTRCRCTSRPAWASAGTKTIRISSSPSADSRRRASGGRLRHPARASRARLRGQGRADLPPARARRVDRFRETAIAETGIRQGDR